MRLGLFFTRGVGLATWLKLGSLAREVAIYQRLLERGVATTFFTYDISDVSAIMAGLPGLEALAIKRQWITGYTRHLRPGRMALRRRLKTIDLIKTNQFMGGYQACAAADFYATPLIARAGYIPSQFASWGGQEERIIRGAMREERALVSRARAVIVTTGAMRDYLQAEYQAPADKIHVIGNFVPDLFSPEGSRQERRDGRIRMLTVGRHHPQKNYALLMEVLAGQEDILWRSIGSGPGLIMDRDKAADFGVAAEFVPSVPSEKLPGEMRAADVFVLCSHYEGHPKALLEAMACGCACVVTQGPGVDEEVEDGVTGLVVPRQADALHAAIRRLGEDAALRARLGSAAAEKIRACYSLDCIVDMEYALYQRLAREP